MATYLSSTTIKAAVDRLGASRAAPKLTDFLVFKRALITLARAAESSGGSPPTAVATGLKSAEYVAAIEELAGIAGSSTTSPLYFSPYGASRDTGRGYKSKKYPSNGPSDTVSRWQAQQGNPLELIKGSSPKAFQPVSRSEKDLEKFLLLNKSSASAGSKPNLRDVAIWMLRSTDVDSLIDNASDPWAVLNQHAVGELGLNETERTAIFDEDEHDGATLDTDDVVASPGDYLPPAPQQKSPNAQPATLTSVEGGIDDDAISAISAFVEAKGFFFHPWQIAAFVTAVHTKPFVILAGISGTGKTKLPRLVAEATGTQFRRIPVRPDWTDSGELLGYESLSGAFVPGQLLRIAREAQEHPSQQFFVLLDEMNVARVEYYLAEVLSHIEERAQQPDGTIASAPLVPYAPNSEWSGVQLPGNLTIVGSVNMDETTFGFSRKVLDRSFVIEFSSVSLSLIVPVGEVPDVTPWPVERWRSAALSLAEHPDHANADVMRAISALETINEALTPIQMQVGYRVRDEVALFVLAALDCTESFVGDDEAVINPLDLAIAMKVLPRIQGTGSSIRTALESLLAWADPATGADTTTGIDTEAFPFCADRLTMMLQRLDDTGFTSFWL